MYEFLAPFQRLSADWRQRATAEMLMMALLLPGVVLCRQGRAVDGGNAARESGCVRVSQPSR